MKKFHHDPEDQNTPLRDVWIPYQNPATNLVLRWTNYFLEVRKFFFQAQQGRKWAKLKSDYRSKINKTFARPFGKSSNLITARKFFVKSENFVWVKFRKILLNKKPDSILILKMILWLLFDSDSISILIQFRFDFDFDSISILIRFRFWFDFDFESISILVGFRSWFDFDFDSNSILIRFWFDFDSDSISILVCFRFWFDFDSISILIRFRFWFEFNFDSISILIRF